MPAARITSRPRAGASGLAISLACEDYVDGLEATLGIRDGTWISTRVGLVNLQQGAFEFMGIAYRRAAVVPVPAQPPGPGASGPRDCH